ARQDVERGPGHAAKDHGAMTRRGSAVVGTIALVAIIPLMAYVEVHRLFAVGGLTMTWQLTPVATPTPPPLWAWYLAQGAAVAVLVAVGWRLAQRAESRWPLVVATLILTGALVASEIGPGWPVLQTFSY